MLDDGRPIRIYQTRRVRIARDSLIYFALFLLTEAVKFAVAAFGKQPFADDYWLHYSVIMAAVGIGLALHRLWGAWKAIAFDGRTIAFHRFFGEARVVDREAGYRLHKLCGDTATLYTLSFTPYDDNHVPEIRFSDEFLPASRRQAFARDIGAFFAAAETEPAQ